MTYPRSRRTPGTRRDGGPHVPRSTPRPLLRLSSPTAPGLSLLPDRQPAMPLEGVPEPKGRCRGLGKPAGTRAFPQRSAWPPLGPSRVSPHAARRRCRPCPPSFPPSFPHSPGAGGAAAGGSLPSARAAPGASALTGGGGLPCPPPPHPPHRSPPQALRLRWPRRGSPEGPPA